MLSPGGADRGYMIEINLSLIPAKYKGITDKMHDAKAVTLFILTTCTNKEVLAMSQLIEIKRDN
jgi:hypothetical protein